ncbi:MAG: VCBS repeat-containing protein [Agriterribacter sp.]
MKNSTIAIAALLIIATACKNAPDSSSHNTLFSKLPASQTGIDFVNQVEENESFNVMTYEYLYNGTGVAAGDVNNDGLADLYFTGNMVPNKLYLNKGNLRFEDITVAAGVAGRERWKTGVTMADVNGDNLLDIYVCYSGPGTDDARKNELYINNGIKDGIPTFTEKAVELGLDAAGTFSTQCAFFDMDLDGDLDAFLVNHADMFYNAFYNTTKVRTKRHPKFGNRLYRNDNGRFTDISEAAGIYGGGLNFGLSISVGDLNNDGWPDLYTSNDYNERDFLYLNNRNGTFREVLTKSMAHISEFSMGSEIADYNNDLLPDIFTLDMLPGDNKRQKLLKGPDTYDHHTLLVDSGFHQQNMRNMLQLNTGTFSDSAPLFSEIGQLAGIYGTDWSWAPLLADFDNDGWKDIFITNGYLRDYTNMDFLKFTFVEAQQKAQQEGKPANTWELVKNLPSTKISNYIFSNNGDLSFSNKVNEWGIGDPAISTGASYADLDNDGDLELIVCNTNQPVEVYENRATQLNGNHFVQVKLEGPAGNTAGIGAKVIVTTDSTRQIRESYTTKGFQSAVTAGLHFGLGKAAIYQQIEVVWPDGKKNIVKNGKADTLLLLSYKYAGYVTDTAAHYAPLLTDVTTASGLTYTHRRNDNFVDFKVQYLIPYQLSKLGPCITKGDSNGDGLEDIFIGGTVTSNAQLYLQRPGGKFTIATLQPWTQEKTATDAAALFFDAEGDGDLDLFISKGGTQFPANSPLYQCELYINNGKGAFQKLASGLPALASSSSCVAAADYDKDGDVDLFIGGRSVPGKFPVAAASYLLRNESTRQSIRFAYASNQPESLSNPGMVTTAAWADINSDTWPDLVLAGEFTPITVYENNKGKLVDKTTQYGLQQTNGLWSKIVLADMDNDNDLDMIAGNVGLNTQFHASVQEPFSICYSDFDKNGTIDPVLCHYNNGKAYPYNSLDELAEQLPSIRNKFLSYESYSNATFNQVFSQEQLAAAKTINAFELASLYFENNNGKFVPRKLPMVAQFSAAKGIVTGDWNKDGKQDIALAGNFYFWRVQLGQMDASAGCLLYGDGAGNFNAIPPAKSGFVVTGDVRDLLLVNEATTPLFVAVRNSGPLTVLKRNESQ